MTFHGYELLGEWKNSNCGKIVKAGKGSKVFFIKQYQTPVAPLKNGAVDAKTFAHNKELFDKFVDAHKRINAAIRPLTGPGGNIIIPCDEFIEGNHFVEVSDFVEGVVGDDELESVLSRLSVDAKKLLMQTAVGALSSVHGKHIVHSDLKPKNILLVRNGSGNYVAKLVDFDSSYFVDEKPEEVVGTIEYYSPELGAYGDAEDDREEVGRRLTEKSDIFSMGLIFHVYLCGALPTPVDLTERLRKRKEKGKAIYCWVALNNGCRLELDPSIHPRFAELINDMLKPEPEDRPTASEVLKRLKSMDLSSKGSTTGSSTAGGKASGGSTAGGTVSRPTKEIFEEPWPEHEIELDKDKLKRSGFVSALRVERLGAKGYELTKADSKSRFFMRETLLIMGYARKKPEREEDYPVPVPHPDGEETSAAVTAEFASPWPEHNVEFFADAIRSRGYVSMERKTMNGINGYIFTKADGSSRFIRIETVLMMNMGRKK